MDADKVFKALADANRRQLLDRLHANNGQTLGQLCAHLAMTRQAVAKHLAVLDRVGLVEGRRHGREVLYAIRPQRLDAATRSMAQVAAEWDARLAAIKRIAESVTREQRRRQTTKEGTR